MSDTGKLYIHIGPPKTATTSLQYYFQELQHPEIEYLGIKQPRSVGGNTIGKSLYKSIVEEDTKTQSELLSLISKFLRSGKTLIISEEMFLVESNSMNWKEKVIKLFQILNRLEPIILFTGRKPEEVIPSYYQELYYSLNQSEIKEIESFAKSEYCTVYKYETLYTYLKNIGFDSIKILHFDKLIKNEYQLAEIFEINEDKIINISSENSSPKLNKDRYAKNPSLKRIIYRRLSFLRSNHLAKKIFNNKTVKYIFRKIPDVDFKKGYEISEKKISQETIDGFNNEYHEILKDVL